MIKAVLFDLDGTFADTAPDLAAALNQVLTEEGHTPLAYDIIRPVVSHGGVALIRLGFNLDEQHIDFERLKKRLLTIYENNISTLTTLFEGMDNLLNTLEENNIVWGIVTNKPAWLTTPLMQQLGYSDKAAIIVSGDTTSQRKPHPEPLFYACREMDCETSDCIYVGDAERDIIAGNRAGMKTLTALFVYIEKDDVPEQWGADAMIQHPREIAAYLELPSKTLS